MNSIDRQYKELLEHIIRFGVEKKDRTGTGTKSIFGWQIRHNMKEGFPLLTTKKMHWQSIVVELLWFLRGDTNIKFLLDYNCNIWNGDAYKRYERANTWELQDTPPMNEFIKRIKEDETFRKTWGELGPIYGRQWRDWGGVKEVKLTEEKDENGFLKFETNHMLGIDQIQNLINELKTNPDSRRLMVNAWNVGELDRMVLPPCHYGFQVYTRELSIKERLDLASKTYSTFEPSDFHKVDHKEIDKLYPVAKRAISLMWNQRSVDTFLGLPFNIASYALLLEIIAKEVNMIPDELIGNLGDTHLYLNHIEQAREQITRTPYDLPTIQITERNWYMHEAVKKHLGEKTLDEKLKSYRPDCFELINYQSHPKIKAPLSN
jgi:thymidylate synthase